MEHAPQQIVITGLGLVCPVGLDVNQACGSLRAGISRFEETQNYYCLPADVDLAEPEPLVRAMVPGLTEHPGSRRLAELATLAITDLIADAGLRRTDMTLAAVYLVLPGPERDAGPAKDLFATLEVSTGMTFRTGNRVFQSGRMGWFQALAQAKHDLSETPHLRCLILAVDSLLDNATLQLMDQAGRIKSERNLDGFIPGECAVGVLLEDREAAQERHAEIKALVEHIGFADEANHIETGGVCTGEGMATAVAASLDHLDPAEKITWMLSDFNGESHRAQEWGHCQVKLLNRLTIEHDWHPALSIGEVGSAQPAVSSVLAAQSWQCGKAPANRALVFSACDRAPRAAMTLARPS